MNESFEIFDCGVIAVSKGIFTPDSLTAKSYACIKNICTKEWVKHLTTSTIVICVQKWHMQDVAPIL